MNFSYHIATAARRAIGAALAASAAALAPLAHASDPLVMSFSTVGDSRQDPQPGKVDPTQVAANLEQEKHWLQNTKAWSRILRPIWRLRSCAVTRTSSCLVINRRTPPTTSAPTKRLPPAWTHRRR